MLEFGELEAKNMIIRIIVQFVDGESGDSIYCSCKEEKGRWERWKEERIS